MTQPRVVLAACSVAVVVLVVAMAAALGPEQARPWLAACGVVAAVVAMQSVAWDPTDLTPALLLSLPPVVALVADGSPTWLIGPLGALLLLAGELNAFAWECQGAAPFSGVKRRRLLNTGQLVSLGLAASLLVGVIAPGPSPGGTAAVIVAAAALAALGRVVFHAAASGQQPARPRRPGARRADSRPRPRHR